MTMFAIMLCGLLNLHDYSHPHSKAKTKYDLVNAIIKVETVGWKNPSNAYNKREKAAGCLQIRPVMLREVNRIQNKRRYILKDRWNCKKSRQMFWIYQNFYINNGKSSSFQCMARRWNGGPTGCSKKSTIKYWKKVKRFLYK